jgi:hypothetical protein
MVNENGIPTITQTQMGLLLSVSEEIHKQAEDVPFIGTIDGVQSFKDLSAKTEAA